MEWEEEEEEEKRMNNLFVLVLRHF